MKIKNNNLLIGICVFVAVTMIVFAIPFISYNLSAARRAVKAEVLDLLNSKYGEENEYKVKSVDAYWANGMHSSAYFDIDVKFKSNDYDADFKVVQNEQGEYYDNLLEALKKDNFYENHAEKIEASEAAEIKKICDKASLVSITFGYPAVSYIGSFKPLRYSEHAEIPSPQENELYDIAYVEIKLKGLNPSVKIDNGEDALAYLSEVKDEVKPVYDYAAGRYPGFEIVTGKADKDCCKFRKESATCLYSVKERPGRQWDSFDYDNLPNGFWED